MILPHTHVYKILPDQAGLNEGGCEEGVVQLAILSYLPPPFLDSRHLVFPPQFDLLTDNSASSLQEFLLIHKSFKHLTIKCGTVIIKFCTTSFTGITSDLHKC